QTFCARRGGRRKTNSRQRPGSKFGEGNRGCSRRRGVIRKQNGAGGNLSRSPAAGFRKTNRMSSRLLLVADEPGLALVVSRLFRAAGHAVEIARDGKSGLRRAGEAPFNLLILDVMLPGLNGFEVCHAVRERGFDGAILMLTAKGQIPDKVKGLRT